MYHGSELRLKAAMLREQGHSLSEISTLLSISKSTASIWLRSIQLSGKAAASIQKKRADGRARASDIHRARTDRRILDARAYAENVLKGVELNLDTSRLLCSLLYWCEGAKIRRSNTFSFTNSDPLLIGTFMRLFRNGFDIDERKLRLNLHVHEYHDVEEQLRFWSRIATIPLSQCHRPYLKPHTAKRTREGYQGCVSVRYHDTDLARRLESIAIVFLEKNKGL